MRSGKSLQEEIAATESKNQIDLTPTVRQEGESIESFKTRRARRAGILHFKLKPKPFYNSGGTYIRPKRK